MKIIKISKDKIRSKLLELRSLAGFDTLYLARGGFWATIGFLFSSLFSLFLVIAFANLLPKETYGTYKYVLSLAGLLSFITLSGMNVAVTQAVAAGNDQAFPYSIKIQLRWNVLYALALSSMAIYYFLHANQTLGISLLVLGATYPFNAALNTYGAYLSGKKDFRTSNIYASTASFFYSSALIVTLFITDNTVPLVIAYCIGTFGPTLFFHLRTLKRVPRSNISEEGKSSLLKYGGHLSLINVFSTASQYVDKIVLFHFLGAIQVAVYGLALAIPERLRGYTKSVEGLILPKLSEKTLDDIAPVFYTRVFQCVAIGSVMSAGYVLLAPFAFNLFLPQYAEAIHYSQIISLNFILTVPASYVGNVFRSQKLIQTIYWSSVVAHVSRIVLFVIFGAYWGIWGVIFASLSLYVAGFFYNFFLWEAALKKHAKLSSAGNIDK